MQAFTAFPCIRSTSPSGRPVNEPSWMSRGVPPVVQKETLELPASDGSAHGLPLLLKLPVIARRNDLYKAGLSLVNYTTEHL